MDHASRLRVLVTAVLLTPAAPAAAQWVEPTGPAGLAARALVAHGPDDVMAGTAEGSAFAFDGALWTHQPGVRLPPSRLYRQGASLFEVRDDSLFASPDGGITWSFTGQQGGSGSHLHVFIGEDGFYAQTGVAVRRTTDGGVTWTPAVDDLNVSVTTGSGTISGPLTVNAFG